MAGCSQEAYDSLNLQIATLKANGISSRDAAPILGLDHSSICKRAKQPEVRKLIETLTAQFARENAAKILSIQANAIAATQDTWQDINILKSSGAKTEAAQFATLNKDLLEAGDKVVKRASQAMGLTPTAAPSIFLQQVFNGPSAVVLADSLTQLFGSQLPAIEDQDEDIIDL